MKSQTSLVIADVDMDANPTYITSSIATLLKDAQLPEWLDAIIAVKNDVIGSDREKMLSIQCGIVPRLLQWIADETINVDLRTESAIVLGSLSKGNADIINTLVQEKTVPVLLKALTNLNQRYTEAVLRCLRSIFLVNIESVSCLYEENKSGSTYIPHILSLINCSVVCQECITTIIEKCCLNKDHQEYLLESNTLGIFAPLLTSEFYKVQMPTLRCFANMCYKNTAVCTAVVAVPNLVEVFVDLMGRDKPSEMQLASAKVLTYLHRGGAIEATDCVISRKTLGTLVRMCKRDRPLEENVKGAETLAYLVEVDPDLQMIASNTDHLISTLSNYLHYKDVKKISSVDKKEVDWGSEMRRAAFLAFAAISANDEEIRDKVIKREGMIEQIMTCMGSSNQAEVAASLRCLQSLTRSVHQIRTVLHDNAVWKPLLTMLQSTNHEIMVLAMTCLCNLVLEFSPSKELTPERRWDDMDGWRLLLQGAAVDLLSEYCHSPDNTIRLNAIWAIMSLTYCSTENLRSRVIETMSTECIIKRIEDPVMIIRQKALAVVRNLLTTVHDGEERDSTSQRARNERRNGDKTIIDRMVKALGSEVIDAVFRTIRNPTLPVYVLEQALCALSNMADGPSCKAHIIGKTEDLKHVIKYLDSKSCPEQHQCLSLQLPVIQFISNLIDTSEDGAYQRKVVLKNLGVQQILEDMLTKWDKSESSINSPLIHSLNDTLKCLLT
ncbi:armadillo repeat-containing protein 8-like isoform X2 [Physella acuta]|uniref:armadillo repeat-containing protein 8-like isoform X2 n=1 Tax=Physella acuta TaxID=109671 RepID=UPI0027DAC20D|nr:armadillo repeat-containing protein 8-like isoform X2 [Physella acuta]